MRVLNNNIIYDQNNPDSDPTLIDSIKNKILIKGKTIIKLLNDTTET
jgi:hypothetical protein